MRLNICTEQQFKYHSQFFFRLVMLTILKIISMSGYIFMNDGSKLLAAALVNLCTLEKLTLIS